MNAEDVVLRLNQLLVHGGLAPLDSVTGEHFAHYLALMVRWNARINLSSICNEDGILSRHFVESIACARALPSGISRLLDYGSGAGLPGIPIALCCPEIAVTLAESQGKKAAFLQEAVRTLGISATVHNGRAETLGRAFDCVTLRAVERMPQAVKAAARLVGPAGWLALMTTRGDLARLQAAAGVEFRWSDVTQLPDSEDRLLLFGTRKIGSHGSSGR